MNSRILSISIVAAVSGFLFGFDTAVISGADKPIQELWGTSNLFHGIVVMSSALWGTVIGALFGGIPLDRWGRKKTLIFVGILYLVSAIGSAVAWDPWSFAFFRFISGIGIGASSVAAPTYISEIAPPKMRGRLVALYQFLIVFGILIAYLSNYAINGMDLGGASWRWMLGIAALPAAIFLFLAMPLPESPRWLSVVKGDDKAAADIMRSLDSSSNIEAELASLKSNNASTMESIYTKKYSKPMWLAFFIAFFNQASGINFIIYYAPRIFEETGLSTSNSLIATMGIGIINVVMTFVGVALIDRYGRKFLMLIGSVGYIASLGLVSLAFFNSSFDGVQYYVFLFIAAHAVGQGAVIWVYISEIFSNSVRAQGQSFGTAVHWVGAALITLLMPYVLERFSGGPLFAFFCIMMVAQLVWVLLMMYETKGKSLEEIEKVMVK